MVERMSDDLQIWTVFDHPRDYPDCFVARLSEIGKGGIRVTPRIMTSLDLEAIRSRLERLGLTCLPRQPGDEPHIIEVWL
jgi:hypothetical protein